MPSGRRGIPDKDEPRYVRPPDEAYDLDEDASYRQHQAVNNAITQRLIGRLTGRGPNEEQHYGSKPSRQYFAGVLASQYEYREAIQEGDSFEDIAEDVAPFSIGVQFRVPASLDDEATVTLSPSSNVYYRRFPTAEEQRERGQQATGSADPSQERARIDTDEGEQPEVETDGGAAAERASTDTQSLLLTYERLPVDFPDLELSGERLKRMASEEDATRVDLSDSLDEAAEEALGDDRYYCERASGVTKHDAREVPTDVLDDEGAFREWLDDHYSDDRLEPLWDAKLRVRVNEDDGELVVNASLVNTHGADYPDAMDYEYKMWRAFLFDVGVEARVDGTEIAPRRLDEIRDEYQYNGRMYAIGENCAAEPIYPEAARNPMADPAGVQTVTLPVYKQSKYLPREPIPTRFDVLAGEATIGPDEAAEFGLDIDNPAGLDNVLRLIEAEMEAAERDYETIRSDVLAGKSDEAERRFEEALEEFREERQRFEQGRKLIENDDRVRRAFKLLNETFLDLGDFTSWRLFQIVFIVMTIPDIVAQADPHRDIETKLDTADVIYYPTGGGKTESYLGLVAFTAFHDRLRGKHYGTTALTKFPLRFLSLDQLERAAEVLGQAELVRRNHDIDGEPFSVGYFVGSNNTPNKLMDERNYGRADRIQEATDSPSGEEEHEYLVVTECPFCEEESVEIDGDHERARIYHTCTHSSCQWVEAHDGDEAPLPIYISDREIYRFAPTFVVSTIDKISIMGMQRRFRTLLGAIQYRCPQHGFTGEEKCLVQDWDYPDKHACDSQQLESVDPVDPPSLVIQDELHLLREEFGSFDSHYETLLQTLADRLNDGWDVKVVAATATIQGAERQVESLYRKDDNIFPAQGPRLKQSFYAYAHPRKVGRNMIGGIPRNVTRSRAINRIHEEQARIVQEFMQELDALDEALRHREPGTYEYEYDELNLPDSDGQRNERLLEVLDDYEVQISYHYAKDNTQLMKRSVNTMINGNLAAAPRDYDKLRAELMTGETPLSLVRAYKNEIEAPRNERQNPIHMIIATSMISHGIDIDRFNFIAFHGMPRSTAEYIQSYSRVGRSVPGTVYLSFNPMQVRDQSHYHQFHHYHEYEDLLVEATPLERWAKYAVEQTISGVLCGALLQYYDAVYADDIGGRLYDLEGLQEAIHDDLIEKQDVKEFVKEAYDVVDTDGDDTGAAAIYADRVDDLFDTLWRHLLSAEPGDNTFIPSVLEDGQEDDDLPGVRYPMMNLRDIDEQVPIDPDTSTSKAVRLFTDQS